MKCYKQLWILHRRNVNKCLSYIWQQQQNYFLPKALRWGPGARNYVKYDKTSCHNIQHLQATGNSANWQKGWWTSEADSDLLACDRFIPNQIFCSNFFWVKFRSNYSYYIMCIVILQGTIDVCVLKNKLTFYLSFAFALTISNFEFLCLHARHNNPLVPEAHFIKHSTCMVNWWLIFYELNGKFLQLTSYLKELHVQDE